jgi:hypothetical protein
MRDDPRSLLADLIALLQGRHVTTLELKGVLRELGAIAQRDPTLAADVRAVAKPLAERIRLRSP